MIELCQRRWSGSWHIMRRGRVTSSGLAAALAAHGTQVHTEYVQHCLEDLCGTPDHRDAHPDHWTERAREKHVQGANWYAVTTGRKVRESGFVIHDDYPWLGFSPGGFVDPDGMVFVQYRKSLQALEQKYICQGKAMKRVQFELLVSGRKWCDYVTFYSDSVARRGMIHRVQRDPKLIDEIEYGAHKFWQHVLTLYEQRRSNHDGSTQRA